LSFNNFESIPEELLEIPNLEILKLRNNPIRVIPEGISQLTKLRNFVLSFCRLTSLPQRFVISIIDALLRSLHTISFIIGSVVVSSMSLYLLRSLFSKDF